MAAQVIILYAAINAYIDDVPVAEVKRFENDFHRFIEANHPKILKTITDEKDLSEDTEKKLKSAIEEFKKGFIVEAQE
jgi:F-type H+-transporting ATPase subunit alpha